MKVYKFGGTSVGTPDRMKHVAELITADKEKKNHCLISHIRHYKQLSGNWRTFPIREY